MVAPKANLNVLGDVLRVDTTALLLPAHELYLKHVVSQYNQILAFEYWQAPPSELGSRLLKNFEETSATKIKVEPRASK